MRHLSFARFKMAACRCKDVVGDGCYHNGRVHWLDCGAYIITYTIGRVTDIKHRSTGAHVTINPKELVISNHVEVKDAYRFMGCHVQ